VTSERDYWSSKMADVYIPRLFILKHELFALNYLCLDSRSCFIPR